MAQTELLLLKPVDGLGGEGERVKVRAGYARNFLLPRGIAAPVNRANRRQVEVLQKRRSEREAKELEGAKALAEKLSALSIAVAVKTGEGGRLFGTVTAADLFEKIVAAGIQGLDKRRVHLHQPVKHLGKHGVTIRVHHDVKVELEFEVVSENPIIPAASEEKSDKPARKPRREVTAESAEAPAEKPAEAKAEAPAEKKAKKSKKAE
jgi:large subunit ribosomal protein L9